jgi:hypothetical protein
VTGLFPQGTTPTAPQAPEVDDDSASQVFASSTYTNSRILFCSCRAMQSLLVQLLLRTVFRGSSLRRVLEHQKVDISVSSFRPQDADVDRLDQQVAADSPLGRAPASQPGVGASRGLSLEQLKVGTQFHVPALNPIRRFGDVLESAYCLKTISFIAHRSCLHGVSIMGHS